MGMVMSIVSDIHHQQISDIVPKFPKIKDKYFGSLLKKLDEKETRLLNSAFEEIYNQSEAGSSKTENQNETNDKMTCQPKNSFKKGKRSILDNLIDNQ